MVRSVFLVLATLLPLAAVGAIASGEAHAQRVTAPFVKATVNRVTPKCADRPGAPIVGRVAGHYGDPGSFSRTLSAVGCFDTLLECVEWRAFASSQLNGRLIQFYCGPRG